MREIKFRGWSKNYDGWIYGSLLIRDERPYKIMTYSGRKMEIIKEKTGQYTGIKDNDGIEIYEGDIVHYDGKPFHIYALKVTGIIVNYKGSWALKYKENWRTDDDRAVYSHYLFSSEDFFHKKSIVIGNIHQNTDLIN